MAGPKLKTSIAVVGCGDVGATLAYTLILQPICSEVILVDPKKELLEAQVRDLGDATYRGGSGVKVRAGDHKDAGQADIVVITAGAKQKTGMLDSPLDKLSVNTDHLQANRAFPSSAGTCTFSHRSSAPCRPLTRTLSCFWSPIRLTS
jgi:L-lactate dehydrogenase